MEDKGKGKSKASEETLETERPAAKKQKTMPARQVTTTRARDEGGPGPATQAYRACQDAPLPASENTTISPHGSARMAGVIVARPIRRRGRPRQTSIPLPASLSPSRWYQPQTATTGRVPVIQSTTPIPPPPLPVFHNRPEPASSPSVPVVQSTTRILPPILPFQHRPQPSTRNETRILPGLSILERRRLVREDSETREAERRERARESRELAALMRRYNAMTAQIRRDRLIGPGRLLTPEPELAPTAAIPPHPVTLATAADAPGQETFISHFANWESDYDSENETETVPASGPSGGVPVVQSTASIPPSAWAPVAPGETPILPPLPLFERLLRSREEYCRRIAAVERRHNALMDQMRRERLIGHGRLLTPPPETAPTMAAPLPAATVTTPVHAPEPETEIFTSQFVNWVSDYDSDSESAAASLSSIAYMSPPPPAASSTPSSGTSTTVVASRFCRDCGVEPGS